MDLRQQNQQFDDDGNNRKVPGAEIEAEGIPARSSKGRGRASPASPAGHTRHLKKLPQWSEHALAGSGAVPDDLQDHARRRT